jgi:hypothetical protein
MDSLQQSIQLLANTVSALNTNITTMSSKLDSVVADITTIKQRVSTIEEDSKEAFSEIYKLKDQLNIIEQKGRSLVVRIFGLPLSEDEKNCSDPAKFAAEVAYKRILKPLLANAKEKVIISSVPILSNVIQEAFRIKSKASPSSNKPPPILVKLSSPAIKTAIFKAKKDALPQPTEDEKNAGFKRFHLAEDLTPATYNFLQNLREHSKIERAWTMDGEVRYTIKDDKDNYVYKAKSSFANINRMLS